MGTYDSFLDAEEQRLKQTDATDAGSPYAAALDGEVEQAQGKLRASLTQAVPQNPDKAAKQNALASATDAPLPVVQRNEDAFAQAQRVRELQQIAASSPVLRAQLSDPQFAALAHDDAEHLSKVESAIKSFSNMGRAALAGTTYDMSSAFYGLAEGAFKFIAPIGDPLAGTILPENPLRRVAAGFEGWRKGQAAVADLIAPADKTAGFTEQAVTSGFRSFGQMLPGVAASVYTGNPGFALGVGSATQGSQSLSKGLDIGLHPAHAMLYGIEDAVAEAATEMIPVGVLLRDLKASAPFFKVLGHQIATEVPSELAATAWQNFNEWANINPDKPFQTYLEALPEAEAQTVIATVTTTLLTAGFGKAAHSLLNRHAQSQQDQQFFKDLGDLSEASKLRERAPASFAEFVQQASEGGPAENVYVNGNVLMQEMHKAGIAPEALPAEVAQQLAEAQATDGDVRIPIGEYSARIATSDMGAALLDHLKTSPEAMSAAEAKTFMQDQAEGFKQQAETILAEQKGNLELQQGAEAVKQHFVDQLTQANRFTPDVNHAYASLMRDFYVTTAQRLGITPQEMLARYPLRVAAENVAGERVMDQTTPEFQKWFAGSKVADATGKPLTVYHGTAPTGWEWTNKGTKFKGEDFESFNGPAYFTTNAAYASGFAQTKANERALGNQPRIIPVHLSIKNPFDARAIPGYWKNLRGSSESDTKAEIARLEALGYDGIVLNEVPENRPDLAGDVWFAFEPKQIKSIFNDRPTSGPNLLEQPGNPQRKADRLWDVVAKDGKLLAAAQTYEEAKQQNIDHFNGEATLRDAGPAPVAAGYWEGPGGEFTETDTKPGLAERTLELAQNDRRWYPNPNAAGGKTLEQSGLTEDATKLEITQLTAAIAANKFDPPLTFKYPKRTITVSNAAEAELLRAQLQEEVFKRYEQAGARGQIAFGSDITLSPAVITLLKTADLSTFLHETGHFFLEVTADIANRPGAPAEVRQDMDTLLKWFGVKDLDTWRAMSLDEQRPSHEKFARGFESYLFEGKAPNVEMQSLFGRFRAWLLNVYKSLSALNVELTPEVRGTFDRMLASEEQIKAAEAARSYAPLFKSAEEAGMSPAEWQSYQETGKEATETAVQRLERRSLRDMQWLTGARGRALKALQKAAEEKRNGVQAEVEIEVAKEPIYAAIHFLKGEEKLSLPALKEMYGEGPAAPWRYLATGQAGLAATEGMHPDMAAELFGFSSGDELVRKILDAQPEAAVVEGMTDQRMLERYGDLATPQALERAADAAVHNDARAKFVAAELKALNRAMNPREKTAAGGSVNILQRAAKQFAEAIIARKKVKDIKPNQYAAAEARAARNAERATGLVEKATEKRNQLVNNYAAKIATEAVAEVEKDTNYLQKFDREGTRKNLDTEYLDQIDSLLERYDLRAATGKELKRRASLVDWVESQHELGFEPNIDKALLAEANRQHYSTLTLEEFRGLVEAVKNIEHLGRLKKELLTAQKMREFAAVVNELKDSIDENAKGKTIAERRASDRGALVAIGQLFRNFAADHRKFASLAREMDGWKDAGPMWEYLVRSMNTAGNFEAVEREKATMKISALLTPLLKGEKLGKKRDFSHVFGESKSLTREERIGIALNMGNAVNRERVLTGEKWSPAQLNIVLNSLQKEEWQFVQATWDYLESFRPQIAEKQRRLTGVEPEWVEAEPITTAHGTFRGGYYPIKYDPLRSSKAEADTAAEVQRQMERGLYTRAMTRRGHLEERVKSTGRAMRYDFANVLATHVDQVIHDLAWHEWLIDSNRLLRALDGPIRDHYGPEKLRTMRDTVRDIAVGEVGAQTTGDELLNWMRHGATIVGLGWRLTTSLLQPIGLTQSMSRIGSKWVLRGAKHWFGDAMSLENSMKEISAKSDFMRLRAKTMQREISEIRNKVSGKDSRLEASYFYMIQKMQLVADIPTWFGAYEKAMSEGPDEKTAIDLADQAVIDAQGSGQIKDLAKVQRGSPAWKLFTNFYSFFNTTYNLTREAVGRTNFKSPGDVSLLAADMALLYTIPALLGTLMKVGLSGDWDDEEKLVKRIMADQLNYLLGTIVWLREIGPAVQGLFGQGGADYTGPSGARLFVAIAKLSKQVVQGEADEPFWKALNETAGLVFHYPAGQINSTADGIRALYEGETKNPGVLATGAPHK